MEGSEIVIGTYENHIIGYRLTRKSDGTLTLGSSFTDDSHRGAIRCLTVSSNGILASSSTDDSIRLHSLKKRKEVGGLFQHGGTVNSIRFFKGGHMLSASEDGTIGLWKCRTWELLRLLRGHKSHVMSVAVHPSGKLGFSVGSDRSLFTWDFTTGKVAFKSHTEKVAQDIMFSQEGDHYIFVYQKTIEVCKVEDTKVVQEIDFGSRINSVVLIKGDILAIGGDDRHVLIFDITSEKELLKIYCGKPGESFVGRIRCLSAFCIGEEIFLSLSTSNGSIKIFKLYLSKSNPSFETVLSFETGVRVTCITAFVASTNNKDDTVLESTESFVMQRTKKIKKANKRTVKEVNIETVDLVSKKDETEESELEESFEMQDDEEDRETQHEERSSKIKNSKKKLKKKEDTVLESTESSVMQRTKKIKKANKRTVKEVNIETVDLVSKKDETEESELEESFEMQEDEEDRETQHEERRSKIKNSKKKLKKKEASSDGQLPKKKQKKT